MAIRLVAAAKPGQASLLRVMDWRCYEPNPEAIKAVDTGLANWVAAAQKIPANGMEARKGEIMQMFSAVRYLTGFKLYQDTAGRKDEIEKLIRANGWELR